MRSIILFYTTLIATQLFSENGPGKLSPGFYIYIYILQFHIFLIYILNVHHILQDLSNLGSQKAISTRLSNFKWNNSYIRYIYYANGYLITTTLIRRNNGSRSHPPKVDVADQIAGRLYRVGSEITVTRSKVYCHPRETRGEFPTRDQWRSAGRGGGEGRGRVDSMRNEGIL